MKRFLFTILSPFKSPVLLLLLAWLFYSLISDDITGDLGRINQIVFSKEYRLQDKFLEVPIPKVEWCDTSCFGEADIIFFGDSYTRLIYPNILTEITKKKSAKFIAENIQSPEETFVALCNMGVKMPQVVVLECGERGVVFNLCELDFSSTKTPIPSFETDEVEKQTDFSTFYKNKLINNHAVLHVSLRDSLFTCPRKEKDLYFYYRDLRFPDENQIQTALSKLDSLFMFARERNICLFYVVAADKYDVYQEFAIDNESPKKDILDRFVEFEADSYYVNTKHVLLESARQGTKDLYYADDTHWSPIGAKIVAEEIAKRMDSLGVFQK